MRAYEEFLRKAGTPIGVVGAIGLGIWLIIQGFVFTFSSPTNEKAWAAECEQLAVGTVVITDDEKMGGQHFCVLLVPIEDYPIRQAESTWKEGCIALGGEYRTHSWTFTCYREEVVESLGARETYSP